MLWGYFTGMTLSIKFYVYFSFLRPPRLIDDVYHMVSFADFQQDPVTGVLYIRINKIKKLFYCTVPNSVVFITVPTTVLC